MPHVNQSILFSLEIAGALLYLSNKICLDFMERCAQNRHTPAYWYWRKWAWDMYLIGSLFVILFLISLPKPAFILASIELGGVPAMIYGAAQARKQRETSSWLDIFAVAGVVWGIWWSFKAFHGLTSTTQVFELIGSAGFLIGLYLLVKFKIQGYFGFMAMNLATGLLFVAEHRWLFAIQQLVSIVFVLETYWICAGHEPFFKLPQSYLRRIFSYPHAT